MMKTRILLLIVLALALHFSGNTQNNNIPDTLFGSNSWKIVETAAGEQGGKLLLQPDGKILVCGYDYNNTANDFHIDMARVDICGIIDESFGIDGVVRHKFDQRNIGYDFALQQDGKILAAGLQAPSNAGSQQISAVSRFNDDGSPDLTFNVTGTHALRYDNISSGAFYTVIPMPDGRILCIGTCRANINGGLNAAGAMRFMSDGSLDNTFDGDGKKTITAMSYSGYGNTSGHLRPDGKIILTTHAQLSGGNFHFLVAQLNDDGTLDETFNNGELFIDDVQVSASEGPTASALLENEKVILAANTPGNNQVIVERLTKNGFLDVTFGEDGRIYYEKDGFRLYGIHALSDGRFFLRGRFSFGFGVGAGIMFNPDGTPDATVGENGFIVYDMNGNTGTHNLDGMVEMPDGGWLFSGASNDFRLRKFVAKSNVPYVSREDDILSTSGGPNYQWYLNDIPIPHGNDSILVLTENGIYSVMVTDMNGCSHLSGPFEVGNLGLLDSFIPVKISLSPNPASEKVFIESEKETMLTIYDRMGRQVWVDDALKNSRQLDISALAPGIYLIMHYNEDQRLAGSVKMVVTR